MGEATTKELYHGTLAANIPSIEKSGLLPQKGRWASNFRPGALNFVYAVDYEHRERLVTYVTGQLAECNHVEVGQDYRFSDFMHDLTKHAAVVVIRTARFSQYPAHFLNAHESGPEPGDWYSDEPVRVAEIQRIITGQQVLDWLQPSEPDFIYRLRPVFCGSS